jgi:hypothetical protein
MNVTNGKPFTAHPRKRRLKGSSSVQQRRTRALNQRLSWLWAMTHWLLRAVAKAVLSEAARAFAAEALKQIVSKLSIRISRRARGCWILMMPSDLAVSETLGIVV